MPASAWLGQNDAPGEVTGYGPLDADTCRDLAARLAAGPGTRWCVTLTTPDGHAVAHACSRHGPSSPTTPSPPSTASPPSPDSPCMGATGPDSTDSSPSNPDADRMADMADMAGWLAGRKVAWLESGTCSHIRQTTTYRPSPLLAHLITIRHRTCSYPGCRRPARRCDHDHTIPHDQGGRTCECNLSALCRQHHRAKQAPGWHLTQPQPGVLTWALPHGRAYTTTPQPYPT